MRGGRCDIGIASERGVLSLGGGERRRCDGRARTTRRAGTGAMAISIGGGGVDLGVASAGGHRRPGIDESLRVIEGSFTGGMNPPGFWEKVGAV